MSGSGGLISFPPECRPSGVSRQEGPAGSQGQITVNYPRQITSAGRKFVAANLLYFLSLSGGWWWTSEKPSSSDVDVLLWGMVPGRASQEKPIMSSILFMRPTLSSVLAVVERVPWLPWCLGVAHRKRKRNGKE